MTSNTTSTAANYVVFNSAGVGGSFAPLIATSKLFFTPSTGTLSATNFNSLSDENKKTDVENIENAVNTLNKIQGVTFRWKDNQLQSSGVIAQELEKIIPYLVETVNDTKSVNYNGIVAFLIEAIKELDGRLRVFENEKEDRIV
jgi:hypothetical protein